MTNFASTVSPSDSWATPARAVPVKPVTVVEKRNSTLSSSASFAIRVTRAALFDTFQPKKPCVVSAPSKSAVSRGVRSVPPASTMRITRSSAPVGLMASQTPAFLRVSIPGSKKAVVRKSVPSPMSAGAGSTMMMACPSAARRAAALIPAIPPPAIRISVLIINVFLGLLASCVRWFADASKLVFGAP